MIKKLVLVLIAIISINSYGQQGTASPYSFYGIGSSKFKGTVENRSMGGLSVYSDSIHINLRNPASYAGKNLAILNKDSRPVKFTVGGSYSSISLESNSGNSKTSSSTFDYLALSFPVGNKLGFGFGLLPFTSVGYKIQSFNDDNKKENRFTGTGGVNKVFVGFGYQVSDELRVGVDLQYNFGNIQNDIISYSYDSDGVGSQYQSMEKNRSNVGGLNLNLGLIYKKMINNKFEFTSTFTFSPQSILASDNERSVSTIIIDTEGNSLGEVRSVDSDLETEGLKDTDLVLPTNFSLGAGFGVPMKWFVGTEYTSKKTSKFSNALYGGSTTSYKDASIVSLGGFYIPQYNSFSSYLKRVVYRAGLRYEKTGLTIENESINEFGMSFGVGLPVGSFFSNANLGFEFGKRGTVNGGLIKENFVNFQISLSLNDRWFQKRKYD